MRISRSLRLAVAATAAATALVVWAVLAFAAQSAREAEQSIVASDVARHIASLLSLTQEQLLYVSDRPAAQWRVRHAALLQALGTAADERPSPLLERLTAQVARLAPLFEILTTLRGEGDSFSERRRTLLIERLLAEAQEAVELRYRWSLEIAEAEAAVRRRFAAAMIAAAAALVAVVLWLGTMLHRRVLRPLARLEQASNAVQRGDLHVRVGLATSDEIGVAGRAVDAMADSLVQSREELQAVLDNVPALVARIDAEGRYRMVNRAYGAWTGLPLPALIGRTIEQVRGSADFARLAPALARAQAGEPVDEVVELTRDGQPRAVHVAFAPAYDAHGQVTGVYSIKSDVHELLHAQAALRDSEARLRLVMEASPLGVFVRRRDAQLDYANPAWLRLVGMSLDEARGASRQQLIHADDVGGVVDDWNGALADGKTRTREFRMLRRDGVPFWVRGHLTRLSLPDQQDAVVGLIEDIDDRRRLDAELSARNIALARSNEDLQRFAYVASHDLQEPLRMVTNFGQLLLRRHRDALPAEAREFVDFMVDGGQRAQALIRDLLNLARVDTQDLKLAPLPLDDVLDDALGMLRGALAQSGGEVSGERLPVVLGDRRQLTQLLVNLIGNALKFAPVGRRRVQVRAAPLDGGWIRVEVRDEGIGIDPRHHDRIFQMFQRLQPRGQGTGTGIGLAICRRVVERHGGLLGVQSELGQGATFHFTLRAAP